MTDSTLQPNCFWERHLGLVGSNPAASDTVHIHAALLRPRFGRLLDIAQGFGLGRVRAEWAALRDAGLPEAARAAKPVERILRHLEEGFRRGACGH
jgi:hypothetical protein